MSKIYLKSIDTQAFGKVAVLCGGSSPERQVSLDSGKAVLEGLQQAGVSCVLVDVKADIIEQLSVGNFDRAFIVLHGPGDEDGKIQSLLDAMNIPYTGSGASASVLAMDKYLCKQLWQQQNIPTAPFVLLNQDSDWSEVLLQLGGKVMVKPAREGSSLGMDIAQNAQALKVAYSIAAKHDSCVIAEKYLSGTEFTVSVLGGQALPVIQLGVADTFYTYHAKYHSAKTEYLCPAPISKELTEELQQVTLDAYNSLGCKDWARTDLMLDEVGNVYLLELNTVPGMTSHSLVPMAAAAMGLSFSELVVQILGLSLSDKLSSSGGQHV